VVDVDQQERHVTHDGDGQKSGGEECFAGQVVVLAVDLAEEQSGGDGEYQRRDGVGPEESERDGDGDDREEASTTRNRMLKRLA
jgi:hypothetical protein